MLMAAKQLKGVAGYLSCPECHNLYKKSRCLPCHHSYCESCLVKLQIESKIVCPKCKETADVPNEGVKEFPDNIFINNLVDEVVIRLKLDGKDEIRCDLCVRNDPAVTLCMDCGVFLCTHCHDSHKFHKVYEHHNMTGLSELRSVKGKSLQFKPKPLMCREHSREHDLELKFYCDTCEQLVCQSCITKEHSTHDHDTMNNMADRHRSQLNKIMQPVDKMIKRLSKACEEVMTAQEDITKQATEVDRYIDVCYEKIQVHLRQQRDKLKRELQEVSMHKEKALLQQADQIKCVLTQLECVNGLNSVIKERSNQEALFARKQVVKDVDRVTDDYYRLETEPVEAATVEFVPCTELITKGTFGQLYISGFEISNAPCYGFVGRKVEFHIVGKYGKCLKNSAEIRVKVISTATGDFIQAQVDNSEEGSYSVSFVCNEVGKVIVTATIESHLVTGCPHAITVRNNYKLLKLPSKIVNSDGEMGIPWGIGFGNDGVWAVADYNHNCVHVYDCHDQLVKTFGNFGNGDGEFHWPYGLAFDVNNCLYVSDYNNNRIQKFTVTGEFMLKFGGKGVVNGQIFQPLGVFVHNDEVFVADQGNNRISVFHLDGQFSRIIGSKQHLDHPHHVAVSADNHLLVADFSHHCISVYRLDNGQYVRKFGIYGTGAGHLWAPTSLVIDRYGFILVTEYVNCRVSVFDSCGNFVHCFGSGGSGLGQFKHPRGIAIGPSGDIYVSDYDNQRIQIFSSF